MICMTKLSLKPLFSTITTVPGKNNMHVEVVRGVYKTHENNIFRYLYFSRLLIWYWEDIFAQENLEFNSFAISLTCGYFFP